MSFFVKYTNTGVRNVECMNKNGLESMFFFIQLNNIEYNFLVLEKEINFYTTNSRLLEIIQLLLFNVEYANLTHGLKSPEPHALIAPSFWNSPRF